MKKTQLDRAIEAIDGEIAVLQAAKARLQQQQTKAPTRKPRTIKAVDAKAG